MADRENDVAGWAIGIDIGGTFTDIVALDYGASALHSLKVLTTHGDPAEGVAEGVRRIVATCGIAPKDVTRIVHATTLFTNALIERRGCRTGLLVTRGFKDVIEIGHERKYDLYDLQIEAAPALVERRLRAEIGARMDARGTEIAPVDPRETIAAVGELVREGIESLAVCLLHAYASDAHERQVAAILREAYPGLAITLSSEVAPVVREFERMSTTSANAYIKPLASRYLDNLQRRLRDLGLRADILMMLSNGGLSHLGEARRVPIELLESGPAAGAISAACYSARDRQPDLLAFDMGGTTAKLCLVENGQPSIAFGFEAARQKRFAEGSGLPIRITTIDLIEIGAGGGSIASQDALGLLKVGPQSAGSEPGPVCYGRGGDRPTVTDANLLLGYLNPDYFAGGTMSIDADLSAAAIGALGDALGHRAMDVAWGIHDIVAENMAGAARVHVAERGRDPRDFVLLCTGGGGPLHSYYVAQKIGVRTIICPPAAGVASAYGLLVAPARADRSRTVNVRPASDSLEDLERAYADLEGQALESLRPLDAAFGPATVRRGADGRYAGQGFSLTVDLPAGPYAGAGADKGDAVRQALLRAFESAYREKFGRTPPDVPIELLNLRVSATAPPRQQLAHADMKTGGDIAPAGRRQVYFRESAGFVDTPVYKRDTLHPGFDRAGPMLIEDEGSTLVVGPRGHVRQLPSGNLIVTIQEQQA
ncbi:hydantoinase/oxoprolinase family protein [Bordetella bronchialis]|uniref:hydantoinase/oxoprolinase family protein n=1 Tax=Bordetella bronchialis TaxID=463025 RepID=UPI0009F1A334|nr:hydantoinase/oxoprolinase family protein [Bordetella bronchialis]